MADPQIAEEYPWLANSQIYDPGAAARLIAEQKIVPILDGLDEMLRELQPVAIRSIDQTITDRYPLIITCRTAEYHDAVHRNGGFLAHAAVLEIQPVDIGDAVTFLTGADPQPQRWQWLIDHLRDDPDGPQARAFRSPLMIDLARTYTMPPAGTPPRCWTPTRFPANAPSSATCSTRSCTPPTGTTPRLLAPSRVEHSPRSRPGIQECPIRAMVHRADSAAFQVFPN